MVRPSVALVSISKRVEHSAVNYTAEHHKSLFWRRLATKLSPLFVPQVCPTLMAHKWAHSSFTTTPFCGQFEVVDHMRYAEMDQTPFSGAGRSTLSKCIVRNCESDVPAAHAIVRRNQPSGSVFSAKLVTSKVLNHPDVAILD
jgi:hypothetical protein